MRAATKTVGMGEKKRKWSRAEGEGVDAAEGRGGRRGGRRMEGEDGVNGAMEWGRDTGGRGRAATETVGVGVERKKEGEGEEGKSATEAGGAIGVGEGRKDEQGAEGRATIVGVGAERRKGESGG